MQKLRYLLVLIEIFIDMAIKKRLNGLLTMVSTTPLLFSTESGSVQQSMDGAANSLR
jgi:hypothetical protein